MPADKYLHGAHFQAGRTALHEAAGGRLEEALKALVNEYCSAVDVLDADEESALLTATRSRWLQGVSILLEAGADVAVRTRDGATVLHLAAENGDAHMLEQLLYIDEIAQVGITYIPDIRPLNKIASCVL